MSYDIFEFVIVFFGKVGPRANQCQEPSVETDVHRDIHEPGTNHAGTAGDLSSRTLSLNNECYIAANDEAEGAQTSVVHGPSTPLLLKAAPGNEPNDGSDSKHHRCNHVDIGTGRVGYIENP